MSLPKYCRWHLNGQENEERFWKVQDRHIILQFSRRKMWFLPNLTYCLNTIYYQDSGIIEEMVYKHQSIRIKRFILSIRFNKYFTDVKHCP